MTGLASYLASSFDGIIYEDQTNKFGKPDPKVLNKLGMETLIAVTENIKSKGFELKLYDF